MRGISKNTCNRKWPPWSAKAERESGQGEAEIDISQELQRGQARLSKIRQIKAEMKHNGLRFVMSTNILNTKAN